MKVAVRVLPKDEVLDSQGRAVLHVLKQDGDLKFNQCRVGKYILLEVDETDKTKVMERLTSADSNLLYNPLIEKIEVEIL